MFASLGLIVDLSLLLPSVDKITKIIGKHNNFPSSQGRHEIMLGGGGEGLGCLNGDEGLKGEREFGREFSFFIDFYKKKSKHKNKNLLL